MQIYRVFFNWCPPKNSMCQLVSKFWHFFDGIYYRIWHQLKKTPCTSSSTAINWHIHTGWYLDSIASSNSYPCVEWVSDWWSFQIFYKSNLLSFLPALAYFGISASLLHYYLPILLFTYDSLSHLPSIVILLAECPWTLDSSMGGIVTDWLSRCHCWKTLL